MSKPNKFAPHKFVWAALLLLAAPAWAATGTYPVPPTKPSAPQGRPAPRRAAGPAQPGASALHYASCMKLARSTPEQGLADAEAWAAKNGGEPAGHCAGVALVGLKRYEDAAHRFEQLAHTSATDSPGLRAALLAQAGQAWILANQAAPAIADQTEGLSLLPGDPDLLTDRAEAKALAKNYTGAKADLDQALTLTPDRPDILAYRASARRFLGDLPGAAADARRATTLDPDNEEAWLEAANIAHQQGDDTTAKADWNKVIQLAPNSPAAAAAHKNLGG